MISRPDGWITSGSIASNPPPPPAGPVEESTSDSSLTNSTILPARIFLPYARPSFMISAVDTATVSTAVIESPGALALRILASSEEDPARLAFSYINKPSMLSKSPESFSKAWITYARKIPPPEPPPEITPVAAPPESEPPVMIKDGPERVAKAMYLIREAEAKMSAGMTAQAIDSYTKALAVYPEMTYANKQLGRLNLMQGDYEKAIEHLSAALDADETLGDTMNDLGIAYLYAGQADKALATLEAAIKTAPNNIEIVFNIGLARRRLNQIDEAREAFIEYIAWSSEDARAYRELAVLDLLQTNQTAAIAHLEQAIQMDGTWYTPMIDAALVYAEQQNVDQALVYLDLALSNAPAWVVYQVYSQPLFDSIRLLPESKPFASRLAGKARKEN
jgi:tetratricopeptide (TPR) repeat protein